MLSFRVPSNHYRKIILAKMFNSALIVLFFWTVFRPLPLRFSRKYLEEPKVSLKKPPNFHLATIWNWFPPVAIFPRRLLIELCFPFAKTESTVVVVQCAFRSAKLCCKMAGCLTNMSNVLHIVTYLKGRFYTIIKKQEKVRKNDPKRKNSIISYNTVSISSGNFLLEYSFAKNKYIIII